VPSYRYILLNVVILCVQIENALNRSHNSRTAENLQQCECSASSWPSSPCGGGCGFWVHGKLMKSNLKWGKGMLQTQLRPFWVTTPDRPEEMVRLRSRSRVKVKVKGQGQDQDLLVRSKSCAVACSKTHTCSPPKSHAAACGGCRRLPIISKAVRAVERGRVDNMGLSLACCRGEGLKQYNGNS